ncbi:hypothetical protein HSB1_46170 [Halogranum salarium B-1]|uniref:Uncharacterized protein n=1 Tax=Halogranum salarium B-1 TaxID=1210908 RepID=J3JD70_9EURY|nr:hypothetical protein HSB1_46170 [Halogranum salarium B-1]
MLRLVGLTAADTSALSPAVERLLVTVSLSSQLSMLDAPF